MKIFQIHYLSCLCSFVGIVCSAMYTQVHAHNTPKKTIKEANIELQRSMELIDNAMSYYFTSDYATMYRFYNPYTKERTDEKASVWMYTAAIEAANSVLKSLKQAKKKDNKAIAKYQTLLEKLYDNADYYLGTFELTSFTQTNVWSVYAVDRVNEKGKARVTGIYNVYDDQMWLVRELLDSYHLTHNEKYLEKAEYLTAYVLDGWDATLDTNGEEHGGIPWGPGYVTKHACSNGPMVSPLVWLHEIYKGKKDKITHRFIDPKDQKTRKSQLVTKKDYYLDFAKKVYDWQKRNLLNARGVYDDMMGDCSPNCAIVYEEVNGVKYRAHTMLLKSTGRAYTYNAGTMLSGAVDLYRVTKQKVYIEDAKKLAEASFSNFAKPSAQVQNYSTFPFDGFSNWFNTVLLRGFLDLTRVDSSADRYIQSFRNNLEYAHSNFSYEGLLPSDLLGGWNTDKSKNNTEGMFMFSFATQWALCDHLTYLKK
jgi:predicted alpha-1,6-mannanase (GH76 family)